MKVLNNLPQKTDAILPNYLAKDNIVPYTPTSDYNPATKKYVDEHAGSVSTAGKSAYEIAVDNGFVGTEAEWLESLKGEDGISAYLVAKDNDDNIIFTFSNNTTQAIGKLPIDIQGDFLTEDGIGNLRYYNGVLQYYNTSSSTWIDTSVTPDNVYILNMTPQDMKKIVGAYDVDLGKYKLKWEEPNDTIIDGQIACVVEKVIIRRKLGSVPTNENDGDLVIEIKRKDFGSYKNNYFIDTAISPSDGDIYYYKAFPMSATGFYNNSSANETDGIVCKNYYLYGFILDQNESDPASMITYIEDNKDFASAYMNYTAGVFDYGDWKNAWFIKNCKPCMLKYDGTVDYYLDPNDYTKRLDGSDSDVANPDYEGNAMVEIPKVYYKVVDNGDNTVNVYISDKKLDDDFVCWSHIDSNGDEIDYCYMPCYNGYSDGTRLRSLSQQTPLVSNTAQQEIDLAVANNVDDDTHIWHTEVFADRQLINLLLLLIAKSTDTQTVFGIGNTGSYSSTSSTGIKSTGTMDDKGLFWGDQSYKLGVKVFGIEHWYGNTWHRIAGYINSAGVQKIKLVYGKQDGSAVDGYSTDGTGYINIDGVTLSGTSGNYISKMRFTEYGLIPITMSGSSTTYYPDAVWFNNSKVCQGIFGGATDNKLKLGAFACELDFSGRSITVSASPSCKPLATI